MFKIGEHLYVFCDTCQVYIIKQGNSAVLIDFGSGLVLDYLNEIDVTSISRILVTHHHRDQVQGLAKASQLGIPIWVPHQEQDLFQHADELWHRREIFNNYNNRQDRYSLLNSVIITGTLKDYSVHVINGMEFTVLPTPGHTVGSISLSAVIDDERVCFTGDLVYEGGRIYSLAATQWSYNGGEGLPYLILSLLYIKDQRFDRLLPSHGGVISSMKEIDIVIDKLSRLMRVRKQNPRLFLLRESPYEKITEHVLFNRTSMANSYVLISQSKKALLIDFGYDFMAGIAAGADRSSRRPWLYTIPKLFSDFGIVKIDACIPTHYHDDHVAGLNLLREVLGTTILCPDNFSDILSDPSKYDLPCLWYDSIPVDVMLPVDQSYQWEEYEIKIHKLSGHTKYSVAIEFTADGKKIVCTGDQYADGDGLICNYVYKNKFDIDDFVLSAKLLQKIKPDMILSGHWPKLECDETFWLKLLEIGETVRELHRELLPKERLSNNTDDFLVAMYPYQIDIEQGGSFVIRMEIKNPYEREAEIKIQLGLPEGFQGETVYQGRVQAGELRQFIAIITASNKPVKKARIGCDLMIDDKLFGEQAEVLVTVH